MSSKFGSAAAWTPVAAILALLGVLPGMPQMIILPAAGLAAYAAWRLKKAQSAAAAAPETADAAAADPARESQINWEDVTDNVQISVEIGYGLIGQIGRAAGRERVRQDVWIAGVAVSLKK